MLSYKTNKFNYSDYVLAEEEDDVDYQLVRKKKEEVVIVKLPILIKLQS